MGRPVLCVMHHVLHRDAFCRMSQAMRTTVDLEPAVVECSKRRAHSEGKTLSAVLGEALAEYLGRRNPAIKDPPFELIVSGSPRGRFPSAAEVDAIEGD